MSKGCLFFKDGKVEHLTNAEGGYVTNEDVPDHLLNTFCVDLDRQFRSAKFGMFTSNGKNLSIDTQVWCYVPITPKVPYALWPEEALLYLTLIGESIE